MYIEHYTIFDSVCGGLGIELSISSALFHITHRLSHSSLITYHSLTSVQSHSIKGGISLAKMEVEMEAETGMGMGMGMETGMVPPQEADKTNKASKPLQTRQKARQKMSRTMVYIPMFDFMKDDENLPPTSV